jgi:hypothetical protein
MLPASFLRVLGQHPWVVPVFFALVAGLFLLGALHEVRNVSGSPAVRRYLVLALFSALLAVLFHFLPPRYP